MDTEHMILFSTISPQSWKSIKQLSNTFDVEEQDSPEHIFDVRAGEDVLEDRIFVWGRDGWRGGYYHAIVWVETAPTPGELRIRITRGSHPKSMPLDGARRMLVPILKHCLEGDDL